MKKVFFTASIYVFVGWFASAQTNQVNVTSNGVLIESGSNQVNVTQSGVVIESGSNQVNVTDSCVMMGDRDPNWGGILAYLSKTSVTNINKTYGLFVLNNQNVPPDESCAFFAWHLPIGNGDNIAVSAATGFINETSTGRSYGVRSSGFGATSGWNYGVFTEIKGANNGAALFASSGGGYTQFIDGKFAGYFNGRVYMSERLGIGKINPDYPLDVSGTIRCTTLTQTSDVRGKTNIADLDSRSGQIGRLRPVTYNLKPDDYAEYYANFDKSGVADTGKVVLNNDEDVRKYFVLDKKRDDNRKYIGFVAQEFKEVFPELVYEDDKGMLSIDYISLIPVLVGTSQEQNETIQKQSQTIQTLNEIIQTLSGSVQELNRRLETMEKSRQ